MFRFCSIETPMGWSELVDKLCENIEAYAKAMDIEDTIEFVQIKEKYGELRAYYTMFIENADAEDTIDTFIADANEEARHTCVRCGEKATVRTVDYISPWCDTCAPKREKKVVIKD